MKISLLRNFHTKNTEKLFALNDYIYCYETPTFLAAESITVRSESTLKDTRLLSKAIFALKQRT